MDKYDFLKILSKKYSGKFEVAEDAIANYLKNFSIYSNKDNGSFKKEYASHRNQMSTLGC